MKDYEVTVYRTYTAEQSVPMKGSTLKPLRLEIAECPGSLLVEYRTAQPGKAPPK
jgi:hypothetical protein